jgi:uncharacterized protein YndB with AHSA1/START domain
VEWTGARYADKPTVEASTWIDADPARVWSLISDIELMPTLSNELQAVEWAEGADRPKVGGRFIGHNEHHAFGQWSTTSQIVVCDEPREFTWAVGDSDNPSSTWRFRLAPRDGGTMLTYGAQMGPGPLPVVGGYRLDARQGTKDRVRAAEGIRSRDRQDAGVDQEAG